MSVTSDLPSSSWPGNILVQFPNLPKITHDDYRELFNNYWGPRYVRAKATELCSGDTLLLRSASIEEFFVPALVGATPQDVVVFDVTNDLLFQIQNDILVGEDRWSQVWKGKEVGSNNQELVAKIFDDALYEQPDYYDHFDLLEEALERRVEERGPSGYPAWFLWTPTFSASAREAWTYAYLRKLQGIVIPRSFGLFTCQLPCGNHVGVHLMGVAPGIPLADFIFNDLKEAKLHDRVKLADSLTQALHKIREAGISHQDIRLPQILVARDTTRVMFVDFGISVRAEEHRNVELDIDIPQLWSIIIDNDTPRHGMAIMTVEETYEWMKSRVDAGLEWAAMLKIALTKVHPSPDAGINIPEPIDMGY